MFRAKIAYSEEYGQALAGMRSALRVFDKQWTDGHGSYNPVIAQREFTMFRGFLERTRSEPFECLGNLRHMQGNGSIVSIMHAQEGAALFDALCTELQKEYPQLVRIGTTSPGWSIRFSPITLVRNIILDENGGRENWEQILLLTGLKRPPGVDISRDVRLSFLEEPAESGNQSPPRIESLIRIIQRYHPMAKVSAPQRSPAE